MIQDCFGPLGQLCAFLGALGFIFALLGVSIGIGQVVMDGTRYEAEGKLPVMLKLAFIGAGMLVLVLVLGLINQSLLPASCGGVRLW